jgi:hypothetical protein
MSWNDPIRPYVHLITGFSFYFTRPELQGIWGGPFNGQQRRCEIFKELTKACRFKHAVETGAFYGDTTGLIAAGVSGRVDTIEIKAVNAGFVRARYLLNAQVRVRRGDSRAWLRQLLKNKRFKAGIHFFYLDAHWQADLPLAEEIDVIFSSGTDAIVMIDDFQVPDDPGYSYDDHGAGMVLNEEYISALRTDHGFSCFYPTAKSKEETGARRGSVVLARSDRSGLMAQIESLRQIANESLTTI